MVTGIYDHLALWIGTISVSQTKWIHGCDFKLQIRCADALPEMRNFQTTLSMRDGENGEIWLA